MGITRSLLIEDDAVDALLVERAPQGSSTFSGFQTAHGNRAGVRCRRQRVPRGQAMSLTLIAWVVLVVVGIGILWRYEHTPGRVQPSPMQWPIESQLAWSHGQSTLLFFAHPKCPCTRASICELEKTMTQCRRLVHAYAIFVKPPACSLTSDWEKTDLWASAERIPGVTPIVDTGGVEARRFRAATSGFVMLYDQTGQLQFRGGITPSRGHRGENPGQSAIVNLLKQGSAGCNHTRVYGCELGIEPGGMNQACCQQ